MEQSRNGFVGCVVDAKYQEVGLVTGRTRQRNWLERPYVALSSRGSEGTRLMLRRILKWVVRALYVSPALIVLRLFLGFVSTSVANWITVGFVCLVCLFFVLLAPYIVVSAIAFRRDETAQSKLRLPFTSSGGDRLRSLRGPATEAPAEGGGLPGPGTMLRARGAAVALHPSGARGAPILVDLWLPGAEPAGRVTEVADFAVMSEGNVPVVVHCASAPTFVARPERRDVTDVLRSLGEETREAFDRDGPHGGVSEGDSGHLLTLHEGDEVEVIGPVAEVVANTDSFDLAGTIRSIPRPAAKAAPYRGSSARPGVIVVGTPEEPVRLGIVRSSRR